MGRKTIVAAIVAVTLLVPMAAPAGAATVLDSHCSASGDFCTFVIRKDSGVVVFRMRAFANYFGRVDACVRKETLVCHRRAPHRDHGLFVWSIRWQGNYPNEGPGEYTMTWRDGALRIGPRLFFTRG
ncbi:MAG TPA: hypothetical protein VIB62_10055 [Actinomycetota bacterium]|jgi:hypothetical protein